MALYVEQNYASLRTRTVQIQGRAVLVHAAAVCARRGLGQSRHSQIAHGAARGEREHVGMGRLLPRQRLLPRIVHARVELCAGLSASLSATGTHAARPGTGALHGRSRPRDLSRRHSRRPGRPRFSRRLGWPARRHHEGLPRLADQRRHRMAEAHVSAGQAQHRLLHSHLGSGSQGALFEPHHNTYDIEFWGPEPMCTSIYLGALSAMAQMATAVGEPADAEFYGDLAQRRARPTWTSISSTASTTSRRCSMKVCATRRSRNRLRTSTKRAARCSNC